MTSRNEMREATRARVLDHAGRLFAQRGFAETTIRDIAAASGVSVGSVMAVGDKTALLVQVFDDLVSAGHDSSPSRIAGDDLVGGLLDLVQPFVTMFTERHDLARIYASTLVSGTHSSTLFTTLAGRLITEIRTLLVDSRRTSPESVPALADAVYFAYIGTLFSWSAGTHADPVELMTSLKATFTAICGEEDGTR